MSAPQESPAPPPGSSSLLLPALALLVVLGGAAAAYLVLAPSRPAVPPESPVQPIDMSGPVVSIELPQDDPILPVGPGGDDFHRHCTICHSSRLILTQPRLRPQQWAAVVQKMVKMYGAPVKPDDEKTIVGYLTAVHSSETP